MTTTRDRIEAVQRAEVLRRQIAYLDGRIGAFEAALPDARAAEDEHRQEIGRLRAEQGALRAAARGRAGGTDPNGYPLPSGPTAGELAQYEALDDRVRVEEARYQTFVEQGLTHEWIEHHLSPTFSLRSVNALEMRIYRLRVQRGALDAQLQALDLTPGELVQSGQPSPEYAEHRERVETLRARPG